MAQNQCIFHSFIKLANASFATAQIETNSLPRSIYQKVFRSMVFFFFFWTYDRYLFEFSNTLPPKGKQKGWHVNKNLWNAIFDFAII